MKKNNVKGNHKLDDYKIDLSSLANTNDSASGESAEGASHSKRDRYMGVTCFMSGENIGDSLKANENNYCAEEQANRAFGSNETKEIVVDLGHKEDEYLDCAEDRVNKIFGGNETKEIEVDLGRKEDEYLDCIEDRVNKIFGGNETKEIAVDLGRKEDEYLDCVEERANEIFGANNSKEIIVDLRNLTHRISGERLDCAEEPNNKNYCLEDNSVKSATDRATVIGTENPVCNKSSEPAAEANDSQEDVSNDQRLYSAVAKPEMTANSKGNNKVPNAAANPKENGNSTKRDKQKAKPAANKELQYYDFAMKMLSTGRIKDFGIDNSPSQLAFFSGKYWSFIDDDTLEGIVYKCIPDKFKEDIYNIRLVCKRISDYIVLEAKKRRTYEGFNEAEFNAVKNHVVFENGIYDVLSQRFFKPVDAFRYPYMFYIKANYVGACLDTPNYDKLKANATGGDRESMNMIDYLIGYFCIANRSAKILPVFADAKNSGKTLLGNMIAKFFPGDKIKYVDTELLKGRFALADVDNKSLLVCLEMSTSEINDQSVAVLKQITGEDFVRTEEKYKKEKSSPVYCKILLATNGQINIPNKGDSGFYKRIRIFPFIFSVPDSEIDPDLGAKLMDEKDRIVTKCVIRLREIMNDFGRIKFPESRLSKEMKKQWNKRCVSEIDFFENAFEYTGLPNDYVFKQDVYGSYMEFMHNSGGQILSERELNDCFNRHFVNAVSAKKRRPNKPEGNPIACFKGVKWVAETNPCLL